VARFLEALAVAARSPAVTDIGLGTAAVRDAVAKPGGLTVIGGGLHCVARRSRRTRGHSWSC
jgi:hypothetical protein